MSGADRRDGTARSFPNMGNSPSNPVSSLPLAVERRSPSAVNPQMGKSQRAFGNAYRFRDLDFSTDKSSSRIKLRSGTGPIGISLA
jgi:hypothetical protein